MRILHLTDTHLGAWRPVLGAPPDWSRAADHHAALVGALSLADELDVDLVVHTGDVFDRSRPPWRWVQAAAQALTGAARRRPVVVLSGNHDRHGLSRTLPLHVPDLHIVDKPANLALRLRSGALRLAAVPYSRSVQGWVHGATVALGPGADLMLAHQAFHGVVVPGLTFRIGAQADTVGARHLAGLPPVQAILCGHIHPRQVVDCGDVPVVHPGCLVHTALRDAPHPEGLAVWSIEDQVRWDFIDRPARPLRRVDAPADLGRVAAGDIVRVAEPALIQAVHARGAWVMAPRSGAPRPARRSAGQLDLFGAGRPAVTSA
jgi:DNA repair exonuclease SbcCD nuclease subunit